MGDFKKYIKKKIDKFVIIEDKNYNKIKYNVALRRRLPYVSITRCTSVPLSANLSIGMSAMVRAQSLNLLVGF